MNAFRVRENPARDRFYNPEQNADVFGFLVHWMHSKPVFLTLYDCSENLEKVHEAVLQISISVLSFYQSKNRKLEKSYSSLPEFPHRGNSP